MFSPIRWQYFHQAWSWYDYPLTSYSVSAADRLLDLVTSTSDLLTLVSGYTWPVTSDQPFHQGLESYTPIRSCVMNSDISHRRMRSQSQRTRRITRPLRRGWQFFPTFLKSLTPIGLSLFNFYGASMMFKGRLQRWCPMLKRFSGGNFQVLSKFGP